MSIIGIIGTEEADDNVVIDGLTQLRDAAATNDEAFWAILGIVPTSPSSMSTVIEWLISEGVAYDIVVHPDVAADLPDEVTQNADKVTKIKTVDNKVVDRLLNEEGTHLLILLGDGNEPSEELSAVAQKAFDGGIAVHDLADALTEMAFGDPDVEDEAGEEDGAIDWEALGSAADEGDEAALEQLAEIAAAQGVDDSEYATWSDLAEHLMGLMTEPEPEPEKPKAPAKKAAGKAAAKPKDDAPAMWTAEALDALDIKQVKAIALASGIEGAGKMPYSKLKEALLGTPRSDEAAAPEEEPEAEAEAPAEKPAPKGRAKKGEPVAGALGSDDTELNHIMAMGQQFLTRLGAYLASK